MVMSWWDWPLSTAGDIPRMLKSLMVRWSLGPHWQQQIPTTHLHLPQEGRWGEVANTSSIDLYRNNHKYLRDQKENGVFKNILISMRIFGNAHIHIEERERGGEWERKNERERERERIRDIERERERIRDIERERIRDKQREREG
jgi:hypothetical protein